MKQALVIEDDDALNEHVSELLRQSGYRVSNAFTGDDGLRIFRSVNPDVVILDIFMPGNDGLEALIEMRRENTRAKILLISGKQHLLSKQSLKMAQQLGADATLSKPFTGKELLDLVGSLTQSATA